MFTIYSASSSKIGKYKLKANNVLLYVCIYEYIYIFNFTDNCSMILIFDHLYYLAGARRGAVVEVLRYKPEFRGIDS
jgi:hypothetical protein